jgi:hypothetical protein
MVNGFARRVVALVAAYALAFHAVLPAWGSVSVAASEASARDALVVICSSGHQDTAAAAIARPVEAADQDRDQVPVRIPSCPGDAACVMAGCAPTATLHEPPSIERPARVAARLDRRPTMAEPRAQALDDTNLPRGPPAA